MRAMAGSGAVVRSGPSKGAAEEQYWRDKCRVMALRSSRCNVKPAVVGRARHRPTRMRSVYALLMLLNMFNANNFRDQSAGVDQIYQWPPSTVRAAWRNY